MTHWRARRTIRPADKIDAFLLGLMIGWTASFLLAVAMAKTVGFP